MAQSLGYGGRKSTSPPGRERGHNRTITTKPREGEQTMDRNTESGFVLWTGGEALGQL